MKKYLYILALILLSSCEQRINNEDHHTTTDNLAENAVTDFMQEEHQVFENPIDTLSEAIKSLVPIGYSVMYTSSGDLNEDGLIDHIIVLEKSKQEATMKDTAFMSPKRPLLLCLGQSDGSYNLEIRNDNMISTVDSDGKFDDPFISITVDKGYFLIEHAVAGGQHWKNTITFRYNHAENNWFLYEDHFVSYKFNESEDPDAEALVVAIDTLKTEKDFGVISIYDFKYD